MFFTWVGTIAAWVALVFGALRIATGLYVAFNRNTPDFEPSRYLGSGTSGHAIDQGIMVILFAIALGTLTEISRSIRRKG
jgi:ABC-type amino acid transport system permease subunit